MLEILEYKKNEINSRKYTEGKYVNCVKNVEGGGVRRTEQDIK